jgi:tetratricopeptide (TPR) repeat protein
MRTHRGLGGAGVIAALLIARLAVADSSSASAAPEPERAQPHVPTTLSEWARGAQLYPGLGHFHRKVSTESPEAQAYFDQGMRLLWAFNHDEATRSFAQAAALDPDCAACYWGVALTVGPNYNLTSVDEVRVRLAFEALRQARAHAAGASAVERALIEALAARHPSPQAPGPGAGDALLAAYAQAMEGVAERFAGDDDVQVMTAEAEMTVHAWRLWTPAGQPVPGTLVIERRLEAVLKRDPDHPGANHYYVHVMEESPMPQAALVSAARLRGMMPAAGHLEHMPAHIMQRVGRYEDAAEANRRGVSADRAYLASTTPPDYYGMYLAHNSAFLAYSAAMEGRKAETLVAVQDLSATLPVPMLVTMQDSGWAVAAQYAALVRFGLWDELIALEPPDARLPGATAAYLYGHGVGLAARGQLEPAKQALAQLQRLAKTLDPSLKGGFNSLADLTAVAVPIVAARLAATERRDADAIALLEQAVAAEDQLAYDEPADWFFPARHLLGAQLMLAGRPGQAEKIYREDLTRNPENGWALYGLSLALRAQGRAGEAARVDKQQARAWQHADVRLPASAFWYAGVDSASCECQHISSHDRQPGGVLLGAQYEAGVY